MHTVLVIAGVIAGPFLMVVIATLFGWRYRQIVEASMRIAIADARRSAEAAVIGAGAQDASPPKAQLRVHRIESRAMEPEDSAQAAAFNDLRERLQPLVAATVVAGTVHFGMSALALLWSNTPVLTARIAFAYLFAAPEIGLVLLFTGASRRVWGVVLCSYLAVGALLTPVAGGPSQFFPTIAIIAPFFGAPVAGIALVALKRLRPLAAALLAWTLFILIQALFYSAFLDANHLVAVANKQKLWGLGIAVQVAGVVGFLWILGLRSIVRPGLILILTGAAGFGLEFLGRQWQHISSVMVGVPVVVLSWCIVWFLFKVLNRVRARYLVSHETLHLCLGWIFLTVVAVAIVSPYGRVRNTLIAGSAVLVCGLTLILLLRRHWQRRKRIPARRLVLLRVFGSPHKAVSLLELLKETWLLFGTVDLIVGTDIAAMTVGPVMLEAYLRRRVESIYLKSPEDVDRRLAGLDRQLHLDGRYAINELYCFANAWQNAVARLVPESDLVLMDLRGFSKSHLGCIFELNQILNLVPIQRIILLADGSTCMETLQQTLQRAWGSLRRAAPSASNQDPVINVLIIPKFDLIGRHVLDTCLITAIDAGSCRSPNELLSR